MTQEIVKFKCPACGHLTQEEQYYDACEEVRILANQIAKQIIEVHISELEIDVSETIKRLSKRLETQSEVSGLNNRVRK
jgi:hypothetical protein